MDFNSLLPLYMGCVNSLTGDGKISIMLSLLREKIRLQPTTVYKKIIGIESWDRQQRDKPSVSLSLLTF